MINNSMTRSQMPGCKQCCYQKNINQDTLCVKYFQQEDFTLILQDISSRKRLHIHVIFFHAIQHSADQFFFLTFKESNGFFIHLTNS